MKTLTAFSLTLYIAIASQTVFAYSYKTSANGATLRWASGDITYYVYHELPDDLDDGDVLAAIRASFDAWQSVPSADLSIRYGGRTTQRPGYDDDSGSENQNVVYFETNDWDYGDDVLAITTTIYRKTTNEIVDSDIVINAIDFRWSVGDIDIQADVQNAVTHEAGHLLGLGHSNDPSATMYGRHAEGETLKRTLASDDILAISTLYPRSGEDVGDPVTEAPKLDSPAQIQIVKASTRAENPILDGIDPPSSSGGCSQLPVGGRPLEALMLLIVVAFAGIWRRSTSRRLGGEGS